MSNPLISVIVPVYKVEPYIHRCVDSILSQTYHPIEIILVDDSSPDNCGAICDRYAQENPNIKVVHRANGGLSAARNSGIEACHGEYIGFVDSDDYIHPEMYEKLYDDICHFKTKIAFCHSDVVKQEVGDNRDYGNSSERRPKIYVMRRALEESIWWSACTKLFHKSLFDDIRFPEGKTNEDLAIMMFIYDRCEYIAINYNKLYFYCIREDSITTSKLNKHKFDIIDNATNVAQYMHKHHPELEPAVHNIQLSHGLSLLLQLSQYDGDDLTPQKEKTIATIRHEWPSLLSSPFLSLSQRFLLTLACIHPKALEFFWSLRQLIKR